MIWIILGLTIAAVGTFALMVWDLLQEKRDSDALDEFDAWFLWNHGRRPTPRDYLNYLYPEAEEIE